MPYAETVRSEFRSGDVLLFGGKGAISSTIKWFTGSRHSHCGLLLYSSELDCVLLFESTTLSDVPGALTGEATQGVQLVALSERLKTYDGEVFVRHLSPALDSAQLRSLCSFRKEMRGRPYEESKLELIRAAYDGWGGKNEEDLSSLFCSELVAEGLQRVGVLGETKPSNEYTPADFSSAREGLELAPGYSYGPEVQLLSGRAPD